MAGKIIHVDENELNTVLANMVNANLEQRFGALEQYVMW
jgi:hypothetical protein